MTYLTQQYHPVSGNAWRMVSRHLTLGDAVAAADARHAATGERMRVQDDDEIIHYRVPDRQRRKQGV